MSYNFIKILKHPFTIIWSSLVELAAKILANKPKWTTNYEEALLQAKQTNKIVLANFTGNDWCPYCKKLQKEVFDMAYFWGWAKQNVVLLKLDFPYNSNEYSEPNKMLKSKYGVTGFPTAVGIDTDGSKRGEVKGYSSGTGVENWIGPVEAFRKDGTSDGIPHKIKTEMYAMELTGNSPFGPIIMHAGDGIGNGEEDGALYSLGEVEEADDPTRANSFFDVFFEITVPSQDLILHNKDPFRMEASDLIRVPPIRMKREDGTFYETTYLHPTTETHVNLILYNIKGKETACFKVKEIGVPAVKHNPRRDLSVELISFTAVADKDRVSIGWETGVEKNNAAFRVWRGISLTGFCSENPSDYAEVTRVTPLISSEGTTISGAVYSDIFDSNVVRDVTYCYALEDIDVEGNSTFHMDKTPSVVMD